MSDSTPPVPNEDGEPMVSVLIGELQANDVRMIRRLPKQKPAREPWIKPRKRVDLSSMTCCKEAKLRAARLALMGCAACGKIPACIHHIRDGQGMGERAPWHDTIPLCRSHHQGDGMSTHGRDRLLFHETYGSEREMLARVNARLPQLLNGPTATPQPPCAQP